MFLCDSTNGSTFRKGDLHRNYLPLRAKLTNTRFPIVLANMCEPVLTFGLSATPKLLRSHPLQSCTPQRKRVSVRVIPRASLSAPIKSRVQAAAVPASVLPGFGFGERVPFLVDEFLMWNPGAKVLTLFAVTLLSMAIGSLLFRFADPKRKEAQSPFWHSVRAIANPLEDDWASVPLRTVSIVLASVGMVVFAILVGMVTDSVQAAVQRADGGYSRVIARDHIVVLGWGSRVGQTLRDLSALGARERVVVLAAADEREALMAELRQMVGSDVRRRLRLLYREGVPVLSEDLKRVSAGTAKKIVLVNPRTGDLVDADRKVISRALALKQSVPEFSGDVVAELNSLRDESIIRRILEHTNARSVETINSERLLFRFMAQAIRQPGLADVVAQLMGSDPATVFHVRDVNNVAPKLVGARYSDVRPTSIPGAIICGYFGEDGKVVLKSPSQEGPVLTKDSKLLLLGYPGSKKHLDKPRSVFEQANAKKLLGGKALRKSRPENFLVCGWRPDMKAMLVELDSTLPKGSKMIILDDDAPEKVNMKLKNLSVKCVVKRPDRYENLEELLLDKSYDHVVLLGSALGIEDNVSAMGTDEDSKALATMVYVNELLSRRKDRTFQTFVTIEFNNQDVANIAKENGIVANAILPQNLGAKIAAQTMRDSRLNSVWDELLSQRGKEVYLVPMEEYLHGSGSKQSFRSIADSAASELDDIVIGYVPKGQAPNINPTGKDRYESRTWLPGDFMIVLSDQK